MESPIDKDLATSKEIDSSSLDLIQHAFENAPIAILVLSPDPTQPRFLYANSEFSKITDCTPTELSKHTFFDLKGSETSDFEWKNIQNALTSYESLETELYLYKLNGESFWAELSIRPIIDPFGKCSQFVVLFCDSSFQKKSQEILRAKERRFHLILTASNDGIWEWNIQEDSMFLSDRAFKLLERVPEANKMSFQDFLNMMHPEDGQAFKNGIQAHLQDNTPLDIEVRIKRGFGDYGIFVTKGLADRDSQGNSTYMAGTLSDVTDRRLEEEQIRYMAFTDQLTGLFNRSYLEEQANILLYSKNRPNYFAILFLDLNDFKPINDTYGHKIGDLVLHEVGVRLLVCVEDKDLVSRLGGDEFVILLQSTTNTKQTAELANRIKERIARTVYHEHLEVNITVSIGIAEYPKDGSSIRELLQVADNRMYKDKTTKIFEE